MNSPKEQNTAAQLFKELKQNQIAPLYLFFGEEDYLIEQYADAVLAAALKPGDADFNLDVFYANECDGAAIVNAAAAYPMMAERRTVIVKEIHLLDDTSQAMLLNYAQKPSPTSCVILTSSKSSTTGAIKKLRSLAFTVEAKPLYENHIPPWIKNHVKARGYAISDDAINLLQINVGVSLRRIASEIDKIELLLKGRTEISVEDVEAIVGSAKEFTVFELGDAIAEKKLDKSLRVLDRLLELGESPPVGILAMIIRHFMLLAKTKEMAGGNTRRDEIAKQLKINPFFVEKYLQQSAKFKRENLAHIFTLLLRADQYLKSSYQKPRLVLELLIFEIYTTA